MKKLSENSEELDENNKVFLGKNNERERSLREKLQGLRCGHSGDYHSQALVLRPESDFQSYLSSNPNSTATQMEIPRLKNFFKSIKTNDYSRATNCCLLYTSPSPRDS